MIARFLLALLVVLNVVLKSEQACCSDTCFQIANKALSIGETLTSTALDTKGPFTSADLCGSVFQTKGSCCDARRLKSFASKMLLRIKLNFAAIETAISSAPVVLRSLPKLMALFKAKNPSGQGRDELFLTAIGGEVEYNRIKSIADYIQGQLDGIIKKIADKQYNTAQCYKTLFENKLNSLCLICSGDASSFFDSATQKFKIKKSYCIDLVNACAGPMDIFAKTSHLFEVIRVLRNAFSTNTVSKLGTSFSQSRMTTYQTCAQDSESCTVAPPTFSTSVENSALSVT